ncbi:MAG: DUF2177 family protein [Hyphomonadaceae bacterium]|nr:DUF2177 family protein [Hyphomonadaceae bacterium]
MNFLIAFGAVAAAFAVLDFIWLSVMGPRLYRPQLGDMLAPGLQVGPAIAFYVIYTLAITHLIVMPALRAGAPMQALINGLILGLAAYATYDLTNWATLRHWTATVALADMAWGALATALACWIATTAVLALSR